VFIASMSLFARAHVLACTKFSRTPPTRSCSEFVNAFWPGHWGLNLPWGKLCRISGLVSLTSQATPMSLLQFTTHTTRALGEEGHNPRNRFNTCWICSTCHYEELPNMARGAWMLSCNGVMPKFKPPTSNWPLRQTPNLLNLSICSISILRNLVKLPRQKVGTIYLWLHAFSDF
jgi:hypothetical protein